MVEAFLICGVDVDAVNAADVTALHFAAEKGNFEMLIAQNVHAKHGKRNIFSDHTKIVELLIANGANIEALNGEGVHPLYYAAANRNLTRKYTIK